MNIPGAQVALLEAGSIAFVQARETDIPSIEELILEHGPNEWNHLPEAELREYLAAIATGDVRAIYAFSKPQQLTVGVVTYDIGHRYPQYQALGREYEEHGYVSEAVTHKDFKGRSIGPTALEAAIKDLTSSGLQEVYAMRHSDNEPSRRMMEKVGMVLVDEFDDPDIRPTGSRRTAVMRFSTEP